MLRQLMIGAAAAAAAFGIAAAQQPDATGAERSPVLYQIDVESSDLYWLVYRAGAFGRLGHNHVISVGDMTGSVLVDPELAESRFEIEIPVAALVVDDPELRALDSEVFDSVPTAEDIEGTRRNMLSEAVLDADQHPFVRITGMGPVPKGGSDWLEVTVELLGRSIPLSIPTKVEIDGETLVASGEFELTHEALGMEPFSVMMGALQVDEQLDFAYRIEARKSD